MIRILGAGLAVLALSQAAMAVSVGDLAGKCGTDADAYCKGVGYGDAMTQCLEAHKAQLSKECAVIVDRVAKGEGVTLF